jgi:hypothetical protein
MKGDFAMKEQKRYEEHSGLKDATHLEISVYYTKGGSSILSGSTIPRGYYLAIKPVNIRGNCVRFVVFTGRRKLLLETARFNSKQFNHALAIAKGAEPDLIAAVLAECMAA